MTLEELKERLEATGFPVTYREWPETAAPPLPFICYLVAYSNNFSADGGVYYAIDRVQVELYTKLKEQDTEIKVEQALSGLFWKKIETYISTEKCYPILYEIEV